MGRPMGLAGLKAGLPDAGSPPYKRAGFAPMEQDSDAPDYVSTSSSAMSRPGEKKALAWGPMSLGNVKGKTRFDML